MIRPDRLDLDRAMVLLIDMQDKLMPLIRDSATVLAATEKLLDVVRIFRVPVLATEQYTKGLGHTVPPLAARLRACDATIIEKPTFSACGFDPVRDAMARIDRPQVIVVGIEAHVCVQQTALDLAAMNYDTFVCADAVGSRGRLDYETSLGRMRQSGVYVTTVESVVFELCERCDTERFKQMIKVIKANPPS